MHFIFAPRHWGLKGLGTLANPYIHPVRPFYLGPYGSFNAKSRALLGTLGGGALGGRSALGGRPEATGPLSAYDET